MTKPAKGRIRVLAIDDDPSDHIILRRMIEQIDGIEVTSCATPADGLKQLRERRSDVLLLDYNLGPDTGLGVLESIHEVDPDCPIVFLTGHGDEELAVAAMKAGAADYLPKNTLSLNSLHRSLRNAVGQARLKRLVRAHQENLAETNAKLEKRNQEIQLFYHSVSHELRTPLTSVSEFIALLLDELGGPLSDEQREFLEIARDGCLQMQRSIDDLLDITRIETGKLRADLAPKEIGESMRRIISSMEPSAKHAGVTLALDVVESLPQVRFDDHRLSQIVGNLVGNALKFTPGGGEVLVTVAYDPDRSDFVRVSVSDTGRGIPEEQLERIFERLYQVREDDMGTVGGLGLGLNICKQLVEVQGGTIWVESEPDHGSTFHFTLPIEPVPVASTKGSST